MSIGLKIYIGHDWCQSGVKSDLSAQKTPIIMGILAMISNPSVTHKQYFYHFNERSIPDFIQYIMRKNACRDIAQHKRTFSRKYTITLRFIARSSKQPAAPYIYTASISIFAPYSVYPLPPLSIYHKADQKSCIHRQQTPSGDTAFDCCFQVSEKHKKPKNSLFNTYILCHPSITALCIP